MHHKITLNDKNDLCVIAKAEPSCSDMAHIKPAASKNFRVVADVGAPTLSLAPLKEKAGALSKEELNHLGG